MKNSTQLFSTVSLLVLLSTTPTNLWAMTNDGTEDKSGTTTVAVKTPEAEKKDALASKSSSWWPFGWGTSASPEDNSKGATPATLTPQDSSKEAEDFKDAILKTLGMTRDQFESATSDELEAQLKNDAHSDNERKFLEEAIRAKKQHQELSLTASTLAAASPDALKQLSQDQALSPEMQSLATSALEVKKQGGTEEEQAAKIIAKATEEWGWTSTFAYYTLGAPVTLPYEFAKGLYSMGAWMFGGSTAAEPQKDEKPQGILVSAATEAPPPTDQKEEVTVTKQKSELTDPVAEEGSQPKKLSRQEKRAKAKAAAKKEENLRKLKDQEEQAKKDADRALADLAALRKKLKEAQAEKQ